MPDKQTFPPPRKKQPMQQTLRYTDPKSDKFWRIETLANQFVVNYGKYGTNGRMRKTSAKARRRQAEKRLRPRRAARRPSLF